MIEALKSEYIINKVGGRFKLTALIQRRMAEILQGARPLVEWKQGQTLMEVVIDEILEDKIAIDYDKSDISAPEGHVSIRELEAARKAEEAANAPEFSPALAELFGDTGEAVPQTPAVEADPLAELFNDSPVTPTDETNEDSAE